ncbi:MAG: TetR/AcrR family transcriptional regulator [Bacteroidia bacterium]
MKKHKKENVIQIGEELFKTQGYHNTGTEDILKKSDYPRSSFYYNFKSKEGFAIEVLEHYGTNASKFYQSILNDKKRGSPLTRLEKFANIMKDTASNKNFKSECLVQKFAVECAAINDDLRIATEIQLNKILSVIESCIKEGQENQEIRTDISASKLSELFHSQIYGGFILSRLKNKGDVMGSNMNMILSYLKR